MELWEAAQGWVGVPWRHRGRSRHGIDCIGLLVESMKACGGEPIDRLNYGRFPWQDGLEDELERQLTPTTRRTPNINDIVLMRWRTKSPPVHIGIIAPWPKGGLGIIHALCMEKSKSVTFTRYGPRHSRLTARVFEWAPPGR